MRWFLTVLGVIFGVIVFMFLDYSLPSRQTVRITDAYNRLTDIGERDVYASPDTGTVQNAHGSARRAFHQHRARQRQTLCLSQRGYRLDPRPPYFQI